MTSGRRRDPAAAGQALDRLPEALRPAAARDPRRLVLHAAERGSIARAGGGRRSSSSPPGWPTPRSGTRGRFSFRATHYAVAWVAIGALVRARRGQAAGHPRRAGRRRRRHDPRPCRRHRARASLTPARPAAHDLARGRRRGARHRRRTVPRLRRVSRLRRPLRRRARAASRSTSPPRRPASTAAATSASYRLVVAYGDRERRAQPRRPAGDAAATADAADRVRRGLERERHLDRRPAARPARPGRTPRPGRDVLVNSLQTARRVPADRRCRPTSPTTPRTLLALGARRRAAGPRPRLPVPADRPEPARRAADQVGRPAGGAVMTPRWSIGAGRRRRRRCTALFLLLGAGRRPWLDAGPGWSAGVVLHDARAGAARDRCSGCSAARLLPGRRAGAGRGRPRGARAP